MKDLEKAYREGWNDSFEYCHPEVGMFCGPNNVDEGWRQFLRRLNESVDDERS